MAYKDYDVQAVENFLNEKLDIRYFSYDPKIKYKTVKTVKDFLKKVEDVKVGEGLEVKFSFVDKRDKQKYTGVLIYQIHSDNYTVCQYISDSPDDNMTGKKDKLEAWASQGSPNKYDVINDLRHSLKVHFNITV